MRSSWFGALVVAVSTVAGPVPALATPVSVPPAGQIIARYAFDVRAGVARPAVVGPVVAGLVTDGSGHGHTLTVISGHGGTVRPVVRGRGAALAFPGRCNGQVCPHVALQAPTSTDLNPGTRNFAYGADVLLSQEQTSKGQNVVQKGYSARGSQWKLQIDGRAGRPSCVLVGDDSPAILVATSTVRVADGRWHTVHCRRIGTAFAVYVDRVLRGRIVIPAGLSVRNNRPLSIGGKGAYRDNDQFNGALDNVWVQIA